MMFQLHVSIDGEMLDPVVWPLLHLHQIPIRNLLCQMELLHLDLHLDQCQPRWKHRQKAQ
jgi:hypothetical protein